MEQSCCLKEIRFFRRSTSIREHLARGEEHHDVLQGESDGSQPLDTRTDDGEVRSDFWTVAGIYFHRHHVEPRGILYVPNEGSFPIPLECIDVVGRTPHYLGCVAGKPH